MPDLYILMGANGAGKSTTGASYLPLHIQNKYEVFDGDKLYWQKVRTLYKVETASIKEAKRIADTWLIETFTERFKKAIAANDDFAYEGHLPENENWRTPQKFKKAGYKIHIIYLGLSDTQTSELRVFERAKHGGHNVPPYEIERNFYKNLQQVNKRYKFIDELKIMDTSETIPKALALLNNGIVESAVHHGKLPEWLEKGLPKIYKAIIKAEPPIKGNIKD
jgi:predicted ABC-type ATPase